MAVTRSEARGAILALFQSREVLDYGDIVDRLDLDPPLVVDICVELEAEGMIEAVEERGRHS